jgi:hypothetical protein
MGCVVFKTQHFQFSAITISKNSGMNSVHCARFTTQKGSAADSNQRLIVISLVGNVSG